MTGFPRKPAWATVLAAALLLNTAAMPIQVVLLYGHAPAEWPAIWAKLTTCNRAVMLVSPLAAWGAFRVCRWGWWALLSLLTVALVNNALLLPFSGPVPRPAVLMSSILVLGTGAWLLRPAAIGLFWERQLQWWKTPVRHPADAPVELTRDAGTAGSGRLVDISRTGALVAANDIDLEAGDLVSLTIRLERRVIRCLGTVVRRVVEGAAPPTGYGLQFQEVPVADRLWMRARLGRTAPN